MDTPIMAKSNGKCVLLVENDFSLNEIMKLAIESQGYHVVTAQNGEEGLEKIRQLPKPNLVLLDLDMPKMGGREFLGIVLADHTLALIPVLVISGNDNEMYIKGATGFLKKPPSLDILFGVIAKLTSKK
jgi:CheY-like chemotaxis protein